MHKSKSGFTIVELLIVIVVIAILATITVVAFNGIRNRAQVSAITADLRSAAQQLKLDHIKNGQYPASLNDANDGKGIHSDDTKYQYIVDNSSGTQTFCLIGTQGNIVYSATESSSPNEGVCSSISSGSKVSVASTTAASSTYLSSLSVAIPHVPDDVVYLLVGGTGSSSTYTPPDGFVKIGENSGYGNVTRTVLFRKVMTDTSDTATISVSKSGSGTWNVTALVVRGADIVSPEATSVMYYRPYNGSNSLALTTDSVTVNRTNCLALIAVTTDGTATIDTPAQTAKTGGYGFMGYQELNSSLTAGPYTVNITRSGSINASGMLLVVNSSVL